MFAIREDRDYVVEEDFTKAARKIKETKKLESKMDYSKVWWNIYKNADKYINILIYHKNEDNRHSSK